MEKKSLLIVLPIVISVFSICGCASVDRCQSEPGPASIRDVAVLSAFHLRLLSVLHDDGRLSARYIGILSQGAEGAQPREVAYELLGWEIYPTGPDANADANMDTIIGGIWLKSGADDSALAVCEINNVVVSIVYNDAYDSAQIERNLKLRHLPPLQSILAPMDMRRNGSLSRGDLTVTGWGK